MGNAAYIHTNQSNIVFKFNAMPLASKNRLGDFGIYAGQTNDTYTHGYIYECVEGKSYDDIIGFDPTKIGFDYTKGVLSDFFAEATEDYDEVVGGSFKYLADGDIWEISGVDKDGETVFEEYKLYTDDLKDAGFVFINPPSDYKDEEVISYYLKHNVENNYTWQRVQP